MVDGSSLEELSDGCVLQPCGPSRPVDAAQSTFTSLGNILKEEGPRGLVRGMGPTILTNAPFSALYYLFYTRLRKEMAPVS